MREIAHQRCLLGFFFVRVLPTAHSPGPWTDFHAWYVKRRGSAQGYAFSGLENKKKYIYTPVILENRHFGPAFDRDFRKFSTENRFTMGGAPV